MWKYTRDNKIQKRKDEVSPRKLFPFPSLQILDELAEAVEQVEFWLYTDKSFIHSKQKPHPVINHSTRKQQTYCFLELWPQIPLAVTVELPVGWRGEEEQGMLPQKLKRERHSVRNTTKQQTGK